MKPSGEGLKINFTNTRRYGPLCKPTFSSCRGLWPLPNEVASYAVVCIFGPSLVLSNFLSYLKNKKIFKLNPN